MLAVSCHGKQKKLTKIRFVVKIKRAKLSMRKTYAFYIMRFFEQVGRPKPD